MRTTVWLGAIAVWGGTCSEPQVTPPEPNAIGYYENLSRMAIGFPIEVAMNRTNREEKLQYAQESASMMFTYWFATRHQRLRPSKQVDKAVCGYYRMAMGDEGLRNSKVFDDPLKWPEHQDGPTFQPEILTKAFTNRFEYLAKVADFKRFVTAGVAATNEVKVFIDGKPFKE